MGENKGTVAITREYLTNMYDEGLTVKAMRAKIGNDYNSEISEGNLKRLYKQLGLNLRKKPLSPKFVLDGTVVEKNTE